jgi:hypothetical protein
MRFNRSELDRMTAVTEALKFYIAPSTSATQKVIDRSNI